MVLLSDCKALTIKTYIKQLALQKLLTLLHSMILQNNINNQLNLIHT